MTETTNLRELVEDTGSWEKLHKLASAELDALLAENEETQEWEKFHPRAVKLLRKRKNFLVIAEDEPYFIEAYKLIREHEKEIGRWTERDEDIYQSANEAKNSW